MFDLNYYKAKVCEARENLAEFPNNKKIRASFEYSVSKYLELSKLVVLVASNEQKPWTSDMIGLETTRMPLKEQTGYDQVGDYQYTINCTLGSLVVERKEVSDLYGTLFNSENRARFYREIDRYNKDTRFNRMIIIVEGSLTEFLWYEPPIDEEEKNKYRNVTGEQKLASIASLYERHIPVLFADNRVLAASMYRHAVRQNAKQMIRDAVL